jgi:hypothetical protein
MSPKEDYFGIVWINGLDLVRIDIQSLSALDIDK